MKRLIVKAGFWALTLLLFSLVLLQLSPTFPFWIFKTTRNKLSLLSVFVACGVEMNTWIAQPEALGILCLPQHKREQLPPPVLLWLKMGGVGLHPAICASCVFLPLLLRYNDLETWLSSAILKWRALAFAQDVLWQWQVWVWVFGLQTAFCEPWHPFCLKLFLGRIYSSPLTLKCATGAAARPWHAHRVWGSFANSLVSQGLPPTAANCPALTVPRPWLRQALLWAYGAKTDWKLLFNYAVKAPNVLKKGVTKLKERC